MPLNLKDWDGNRVLVAQALLELMKLYPNDPLLQIILDGTYSQQLRIDQLVNQLNVIREQSKLSRGAEDNTKRLIQEVQTFAGRVGGE